ncbi:MAG: sulfite exporter TauE/SafE family protein [Pseudomonadota bacterium]
MTGLAFGLDLGGLLIAAAALFIGGFARGLTGFGNAAIIMAALTLFLSPREVVPVAVGLEVVAGIIQLPFLWAQVNRKLLATLMVGAVCATPFGVLALVAVDGETVRLAILAFILVASVVLLSGLALPRAKTTLATLAAGAVSGFANGAAGLSGLPIALFLAARSEQATMMRATLAIYILLIGLATLAIFAWRDLLIPEAINRTAAGTPLMIAGLIVGMRSFAYVSPSLFRRITLVLLMAIAAFGTARTILAL